MEEGEQDRSEQPTRFKLQRARQKGTVARGMDLGFLTGLAAFVGFVWMAGPGLIAQLVRAARDALLIGPQLAEGNSAVLVVIGLLFSSLAKPLLLMAGLILLVVLLFEMLQTGVVFSAQPLRPDFGRLNPAKGLKRLFTVRLLIETLKNVLKLAAYSAVGWLVIDGVLRAEIGAVTDARSLLALAGRATFRLLAAFLLVAFGFAVIDQLLVRRDFTKRMRMSRRELRREHRDREGEPRLKQKRKQLHAAFVQASQSVRGMRGADLVIANPDHIALALRYDPARMQAPTVVSRGAGHLARRLKKLAFLYGVPIVERPSLARALFRSCNIHEEIPEAFFRPVADIYNGLKRRADSGESDGGDDTGVLRAES